MDMWKTSSARCFVRANGQQMSSCHQVRHTTLESSTADYCAYHGVWPAHSGRVATNMPCSQQIHWSPEPLQPQEPFAWRDEIATVGWTEQSRMECGGKGCAVETHARHSSTERLHGSWFDGKRNHPLKSKCRISILFCLANTTLKLPMPQKQQHKHQSGEEVVRCVKCCRVKAICRIRLCNGDLSLDIPTNK